MTETTPRLVVVVADDEPAMLDVLVQHLRAMRSPRFEVSAAEDGEEAWEQIQDRLPDLVVLDVMMPGMSGWELCRKIRESAALVHTAVVILTGIGERTNELTSPLFGADAHLDKPFEFEDLDARVVEALALRVRQRSLPSAPSSSATLGRSAAAPAPTRATGKEGPPKASRKPGAKAAPKAASRPAKKVAAKSGGKVAAKSGGKAAPTAARKRAKKVDAKPVGQAGKASSAKATSKVASKVASKAASKAGSKRASKAVPRAAKRSGAKVASKSARKAVK